MSAIKPQVAVQTTLYAMDQKGPKQALIALQGAVARHGKVRVTYMQLGAVVVAPGPWPGAGEPIEMPDMNTQQPSAQLTTTLVFEGDSVPAALLELEALVEMMHGEINPDTGKKYEYVIIGASANAVAPDIMDRWPELMKLAGKMMRRGIDRGHGDEWKPDDLDDDEEGPDEEPT